MLQQSPQTQLLIGNQSTLVDMVERLLQKTFCKSFNDEQGCFCATCRNIKRRQYKNLLWLCPEKDYRVQDIEVIFDKTTFSLEKGESFYIILERADTFNDATANRLLKILEEPAPGYHFILLADNQDHIMQTIRSRCHIIQTQPVTTGTVQHPIINYFLQEDVTYDPFTFEQTLKKLAMTDTQSTQLAHQLLHQLSVLIKEQILLEQPDRLHVLMQRIETVQKALRKPAQSGSAELFWKSLYLACCLCH